MIRVLEAAYEAKARTGPSHLSPRPPYGPRAVASANSALNGGRKSTFSTSS